MKKIVTFSMALVCALGLAGCGQTSTQNVTTMANGNQTTIPFINIVSVGPDSVNEEPGDFEISKMRSEIYRDKNHKYYYTDSDEKSVTKKEWRKKSGMYQTFTVGFDIKNIHKGDIISETPNSILNQTYTERVKGRVLYHVGSEVDFAQVFDDEYIDEIKKKDKRFKIFDAVTLMENKGQHDENGKKILSTKGVEIPYNDKTKVSFYVDIPKGVDEALTKSGGESVWAMFKLGNNAIYAYEVNKNIDIK